MTTDEIMNLHAECMHKMARPANEHALRSAIDTLVAERDALRTERDTLRQVIEQQLLNVPVGEWKK